MTESKGGKMKKITLVILIGVFVFGSSTILFAQTQDVQQNKKAEDVENKICPVLGEKIDEKLKATYEYKGKIYNFCCAMCIDAFKKDPEKYIKIIEEQKAREKSETTQSSQKNLNMEHIH